MLTCPICLEEQSEPWRMVRFGCCRDGGVCRQCWETMPDRSDCPICRKPIIQPKPYFDISFRDLAMLFTGKLLRLLQDSDWTHETEINHSIDLIAKTLNRYGEVHNFNTLQFFVYGDQYYTLQTWDGHPDYLQYRGMGNEGYGNNDELILGSAPNQTNIEPLLEHWIAIKPPRPTAKNPRDRDGRCLDIWKFRNQFYRLVGDGYLRLFHPAGFTCKRKLTLKRRTPN